MRAVETRGEGEGARAHRDSFGIEHFSGALATDQTEGWGGEGNILATGTIAHMGFFQRIRRTKSIRDPMNSE